MLIEWEDSIRIDIEEWAERKNRERRISEKRSTVLGKGMPVRRAWEINLLKFVKTEVMRSSGDFAVRNWARL
jgi:hypothetical protein